MEFQQQALVLSADLFTSLQRTPWAGSTLAKTLKKQFASHPEQRIGESWDISCDPQAPSRIDGSSLTLAEAIALDPKGMLSPFYVQHRGVHCEILVKLLNAAEPLSVQVHPDDQFAQLKPGEGGKPESWLVVAAEPGAGLYLGFSQALTREELRQKLAQGHDLESCLHFESVVVGDYFEIMPGVPHAIAPGTVLLEPQNVKFGKSGKTYRLWDWGRRYDQEGKRSDKDGQPRELHIEESLALIEPDQQVGLPFVKRLKRSAKALIDKPSLEILAYPANDYYQLFRIQVKSKTRLTINLSKGFATSLCLSGQGKVYSLQGKLSLFREGQPGFWPSSIFPAQLEVDQDMQLVLVIPSQAEIHFSV